MFVEGVQSSVRQSLKHWSAEHQDASLEDVTQKEEFLVNLQGHKIHGEQLSDTNDEPPRQQTYG